MGSEHETLFPRQDGGGGGWTIDVDFMETVQEIAESTGLTTEYLSLENIEAVLLAAEKAMDA